MKRRLLEGARAAALITAMVFVAGSLAFTVRAQGHTGHTGQQPQRGQGQSGQTQTGHTGHMQSGDMPYDLHFIDMTVMHHRHGIEMAKLAEEKAEHPQVKAFATKTRKGQEKDIAELQRMRDRWYEGKPAMEHREMPGMSHDEMQKKMEEHISALKENSGHGFDHQFVDLMAAHH